MYCCGFLAVWGGRSGSTMREIAIARSTHASRAFLNPKFTRRRHAKSKCRWFYDRNRDSINLRRGKKRIEVFGIFVTRNPNALSFSYRSSLLLFFNYFSTFLLFRSFSSVNRSRTLNGCANSFSFSILFFGKEPSFKP